MKRAKKSWEKGLAKARRALARKRRGTASRAKKNPRKPTRKTRVVASVRYVITARRSKNSPRMMFDGKNFSQRTPKTYSKDEHALTQAKALVKRHPILRKYRVAIETYGGIHRRP